MAENIYTSHVLEWTVIIFNGLSRDGSKHTCPISEYFSGDNEVFNPGNCTKNVKRIMHRIANKIIRMGEGEKTCIF